MPDCVTAYLGLGSNEGDRKANLKSALSMLDSAEGISVERVSDVIETTPWGFDADMDFLNCAAKVNLDPSVTPELLLKVCKNIEKRLGRDENIEFDDAGRRIYHSRTIDIDILLYGDSRIRGESLTVPHPLMKERDFVMIPLRQIADRNVIEAFPDIFGGEAI